jgi:hypothetical protein
MFEKNSQSGVSKKSTINKRTHDYDENDDEKTKNESAQQCDVEYYVEHYHGKERTWREQNMMMYHENARRERKTI